MQAKVQNSKRKAVNQRWIRGHKAPAQGQGHKKKIPGQEQGHRRKCSPKKGLQKVFQAISKREKQKRSLQIFREVCDVFLHNFKNEQIPTIVETDAVA